MTELYLEGSQHGSCVCVSCSSAVVLYLLSYCKTPDIHLTLVSDTETPKSVSVPTATITELHAAVSYTDKSPSLVNQCKLPALVPPGGSKVLSGLCGILRKIVKMSSNEKNGLLSLLSRREVCLKACAEVSVWTKFCEVEIPATVDQILGATSEENGMTLTIPGTLLKLENHFKQPAIIANTGKRRPNLKKQSINDTHEQLNGCTSSSDIGEEFVHRFVEGAHLTLADLVIFFSLSCLLKGWAVYLADLASHLPLTISWYTRLCEMSQITSSLTHLPVGLPIPAATVMAQDPLPPTVSITKEVRLPTGNPEQFHIREEKKKKLKASRSNMVEVLLKTQELKLGQHLVPHPCDRVSLPWSEYPLPVHPKDGDLPVDRLERKCHQLESLATAVTRLAQPGHTIVDFCSGGGHLGILLAYLLPQCKIILVENKEESIVKAEHRICKLDLKNISIYQCNLDYFHGDFDIGTCLHACGVATDLVLQSCLIKNAAFVVCPCCYGNIQDTHTVTFPQSQRFKDSGLEYKEYLMLGHGADQTELNIPAAKLGKECMLMVDSDRASTAQEHGYDVIITTLQPPNCSPKNNILIGTKIYVNNATI